MIKLSANNLSIGYKTKNQSNILLEKANLSFYQGKLYSILGANGIGKSTLINVLNGYQKPLSGDVYIENKNLLHFNNKKLSKIISVVHTQRLNIEYKTLFDFVCYGRIPFLDFYGNMKNIDIDIVKQSIIDVGLAEKSNEYINNLSDGEYQKALIAKAISQQTPIIIMDEPVSYLDYANKLIIMNLIKYLSKVKKKTIIISLHHIDLAIDFSDKILLFTNNKNIIEGVPEDLILNNSFENLYNNDDLIFNKIEGNYKIENFKSFENNIIGNNLQKKWLNHALIRNNIDSFDFLIDIKDNSYNLIKENKTLFKAQNIDELMNFLINNK